MTGATTLLHSAVAIDERGTREDAWLLVEDGIIRATGTGLRTAPDAPARVDLAGARVCPGFLDLHVHGGGGAAFDDGPTAMRAALDLHRAHGTTRSIVSLVTAPLDALLERLAAVADLAEHDPLVLGAHLEGPYLADARRGAHPSRLLRTPEPGEVDALLAAGRGRLRQVTLAPELPGAFDAIERLTRAGVVVAIGHTDADAATTRAAIERGARLLTHTFNGMAGIHHRAPGPVPVALLDERMTLELVLDGVHVDHIASRMLFAAAPGRIALVTDAMAAAGAADGEYLLGVDRVRVRNGIARLAAGDSLAGSTLTQDVALRIAILELGLEPAVAVAALTAVPARALGLDDRLGLLAPGYAADLVVLDDTWAVRSVWAEGQRIA